MFLLIAGSRNQQKGTEVTLKREPSWSIKIWTIFMVPQRFLPPALPHQHQHCNSTSSNQMDSVSTSCWMAPHLGSAPNFSKFVISITSNSHCQEASYVWRAHLEGHNEMSEVKLGFKVQLDGDILQTWRATNENQFVRNNQPQMFW